MKVGGNLRAVVRDEVASFFSSEIGTVDLTHAKRPGQQHAITTGGKPAFYQGTLSFTAHGSEMIGRHGVAFLAGQQVCLGCTTTWWDGARELGVGLGCNLRFTCSYIDHRNMQSSMLHRPWRLTSSRSAGGKWALPAFMKAGVWLRR